MTGAGPVRSGAGSRLRLYAYLAPLLPTHHLGQALWRCFVRRLRGLDGDSPQGTRDFATFKKRPTACTTTESGKLAFTLSVKGAVPSSHLRRSLGRQHSALSKKSRRRTRRRPTSFCSSELPGCCRLGVVTFDSDYRCSPLCSAALLNLFSSTIASWTRRLPGI